MIDREKRRRQIRRNLTIGLTGTFLVLLAVLAIYLIWSGYSTPFYSADAIQKSCEILGISSTEFCTAERKMTYEDLEQALYSVYTPEVTTYDALSSAIAAPSYYHSGTCTDIIPDESNLCPEPSRCSSSYSCYVQTPAQTIHFGFDDEGRLGGFSIVAQ